MYSNKQLEQATHKMGQTGISILNSIFWSTALNGVATRSPNRKLELMLKTAMFVETGESSIEVQRFEKWFYNGVAPQRVCDAMLKITDYLSQVFPTPCKIRALDIVPLYMTASKAIYHGISADAFRSIVTEFLSFKRSVSAKVSKMPNKDILQSYWINYTEASKQGTNRQEKVDARIIAMWQFLFNVYKHMEDWRK